MPCAACTVHNMVMSHLTPFREDKAIASFDTRLIYGFHGYILHGNIYAMWAKLARKTRKQMFLRNIEVRAKQNTEERVNRLLAYCKRT